jgi:uncharacterized protein (TIGR02996 family)
MMNDHDAFLQAIIAEPDEDAPRLVYSDWLEERGDPRAEFIRIQCALARPERNSLHRSELREREQKLLAEYGQEWLKPLRGFGKLLRFRRGFVEGMTITAEKFLHRGDDLFRLAPIRTLRIEQVWTQMLRVAACQYLTRLREISFSANNLGEPDMHVLAASPHLFGLTSLNMSSNRIGSAGAAILVDSSHLNGLFELDVGGNLIYTGGAETLVRLPGLARLTSLNLSFNVLGDAGMQALAGSPQVVRLVTLSLCLCGIGNTGAQALAASPHLAHLKALSLRRNLIGAPGAQALIESPYLTRLARLDLAGNDLNREARRLLKAKFGGRVVLA